MRANRMNERCDARRRRNASAPRVAVAARRSGPDARACRRSSWAEDTRMRAAHMPRTANGTRVRDAGSKCCAAVDRIVGCDRHPAASARPHFSFRLRLC
jgi:hypothetical protein